MIKVITGALGTSARSCLEVAALPGQHTPGASVAAAAHRLYPLGFPLALSMLLGAYKAGEEA